MSQIRILTLNPGHFHAALVQKEMYPGVSNQAHVYAPLGPDLLAHLQLLAGFNARPEQPTNWQVEVHAGPDFLERALREKPGNVVVLAGRNRIKMDAILAAVKAGLNVLADKPWVLVPEDLPKLQEALNHAEANGLVAYDIMTERFEITSILQRELVQDEAVFGHPEPGTAGEPSVFMESVHYLKKTVAGAPLRRPPWFFDVHEQGEALSDVGTHLVDLVSWILFAEQAVDLTLSSPLSGVGSWANGDLVLHAAKRWPTVLRKEDFRQITGEADFPPNLRSNVRGGKLEYFCNSLVHYALRGLQVKLNVLWDFEAAPGAGDTHLAVFRGTKSQVEVRQGKEEKFRAELFVVPHDRTATRPIMEKTIARLQSTYPGVSLVDQGERMWVTIPDKYRIGHEAHFAEVTRQFLRYVRREVAVPLWEKPNMLAKYWVTTNGAALSRSAVK
ncbi:MAG: hypothetical protein L0Y70_24660 [Gemmataceae bacterium]|nr:hypothetical protein [Gemmataceae bacterium]